MFRKIISIIIKYFLRRKLLRRTIGVASFFMLCAQFNLFTISDEFKKEILNHISNNFWEHFVLDLINNIFQDTDYLFVGILLFLVIFCLVLEFLKDIDGKVILNIGVFQNINQTFHEN